MKETNKKNKQVKTKRIVLTLSDAAYNELNTLTELYNDKDIGVTFKRAIALFRYVTSNSLDGKRLGFFKREPTLFGEKVTITEELISESR